jgi:hypothetical protein
MHVCSPKRILAAASLAICLTARPPLASAFGTSKHAPFAAETIGISLTARPPLVSAAGSGGARGFQNRKPQPERFITPQSAVDRAYKSQLTVHMVRGQGIEADIMNKNRRGLLDLIEFLFKNEFAKGNEQRYVSRQLDILVKGERMFTGKEKGQVVLGMALALGENMRAVSKGAGGKECISSIFGTFMKIAPESVIPLREMNAWVLSDEAPESLADRLLGAAAPQSGK